MQDHRHRLSRRAFLGALAGAAAPVLRQAIPATGETVPVIGMGT